MAFGIFIIACGTTHFVAVVTIWEPVYWLAGGVKLATMIVSLGTAIALVPMMPRILTIPTPSELLHANNELTAVNKELEAFSYSVSHDLRAPLRGIDGFSQALLEDYTDKLDENGKDYLNRVRASALQMSQLIDDLLALSRVTRSEIKAESLDLSSLAQDVADDLDKDQKKRNVKFTIEAGMIALGDKRLLRVVLYNLISNAWKFTEKSPEATIEFGSTVQDGKTAYFVRDNGVGFDMRHSGKLFGAFQRLHSVAEFEGTGIGLATVSRIVHRHGGQIWAEAEVDKGATFFFTLQ